MATDGSLTRTERRRPAREDICPLESKSLRTDGETPVSGDTEVNCDITVTREHIGSCLNKVWLNSPVDVLTNEASEDELGRLDIDLDRTSKQHNLTSSNVRAILHEVITHEHVVAMMKAAIRDTQDLPMFEPKMTRSRLKQAVQQGQPLNWSLSALNSATVKPPQFVDIDLEDDEDSSDEEYCPDEEEEEDDTAEETFLSDADSLASPPRMHQGSQPKLPADQGTYEPRQRSPGHLGEQVMTSSCAPHHLLTAPESSFLERLNAVEEELDCSPAYTYNQSLDRKADDDGDGRHDGSGGLAYRTRSKLRLVNVPLGQLEAALLAPDITADMYEQNAAQREEDRHWTKWLQGLMAPDSEDEGDDDDDPEYNFVDDQDEPDLEDYRTDRAVQITKKEVNELLEELFDTLQEEEEVAAEEQEEEEVLSQTGPKFNIPQALRFEAPLASMLTERRRTVRKQYEALQQKRALQDTTNHHRDNMNLKDTPSPQPDTIAPVLVLPSRVYPALHLDYTQKLQIQQQIQQHVQLLTQVHLLSRHVDALNHETCISKRYLEELQQFASRREEVFLPSSFRVGNLQGALDLLQEVEQRAEPPPAPPAPPAPSASRRWLPRMTPATNSLAFPLLPADTAWLFATRPVFLYPELLPVCNLDPTIHTRHRSVYTAGEDGLIVLGLKHFEGVVQSDQLISSYLLCKNRWNFRKHVREMSGSRAPHNSVIKMFLTQGVVPPLPLACSRVQPGDRRPPVDRNTPNMPNWLKNSQLIIQKTRLNSTCYPPSLPPGCTLRLHPSWLKKSSHPPPPRHRRLFTLAHNASLLPLAKALEDTQVEGQAEMQPISYLSLPPPGVTLLSDFPAVSGALAPPPARGAVPLAAVRTVPTHPVCADIIHSCVPIGQRMQQSVSRQQSSGPAPILLPLPSMTHPVTTNPIMPCSADAVKPGYFLLQMVWTPPSPPTISSHHALGREIHRPMTEESTRPRLPLEVDRQVEEEKQEEDRQEEEEKKVEEEDRQVDEGRQVEEERQEEEEESSASASTLSPPSSCAGEEEEENWTALGVVRLNGGENTGGEEEEGRDGGGEGGGGEEEAGGGGDGEQGGEGEDEGEEEEGQREDRGGEREEDGEKDKDEDQDRQGDEEEEEDFDDLTQDEDEEEVMSSASEESVLSVPELQETMKQLTWLAAERRLCTDGDSEEDHSPTSPGSQEEEEEEEEEGPKGEESGEGRSSKAGRDEETPSGEGTPRGGGRCPGRGRGRSRPLRGLRRSRQERHSKDAAKLLLLYDENILNNDPHRESKDVAFAQSYLNRVREALQDVPGQVEEFVSLLNDFEQVGEGQEVMLLFRKLRCILGERTDLLRDFAAFLHPEQALQCGLFEEQQAFERSRRFLRQLEISFGDNPSHYQKIIKALQTGPDLSPTSIHELKAQMATLLKGHTHLQAEFWVFFDELRPPPARPGQFEEAHWPEDGGGGSDGGEGVGHLSGGGASSGFEEVTLPELDEEEEGHKIQPMTGRRRRRKIDYKDCDWSDKDWPCLCRDVKMRRHRRKGCSHCHGNKTSGGVSRAMKSLDPLYSQISSAHDEPGDKDLDLKGDDDSPQPDRSGASWEGSFPLIDEKEEEEEELDDEEEDEDEEERKSIEKEQSPAVKRSRREEVMGGCSTSSILSTSLSVTSSNPSTSSMISSVTSSDPSTSSMISSVTSSNPSTSSMISSVTSSDPSTSSMISSVTSSDPSTSSMISSVTSSDPSTSSMISSLTSSNPSTSSMISSVTSSNTSTSSMISSVTSSTSSSMISSVTSSTTSSITSSITSSMISTPSITSSIFTSTSVSSSVSSSPSFCTSSSTSPTIFSSSSAPPPRPSPPPDLPVCAKNISLTASGEKVILWTREADRVILTTCQQEGANQNTFQAVSTLLGNKTPSEVSRRFRDLMRLFRTAARQTGSEDEAPPTEAAAANEKDE